MRSGQFKVSAISIAVIAAFTAPLAMAQSAITDNGAGSGITVNGPTTLSGSTSIAGNLGVLGAVSTSGLTSTGTTNINTSGTATTNIGTVGGTTNVVGTTSVTGATNINTSGAAATQIGGAGTSAVTVTSGSSSVTTSNTGVSVVGSDSNSLTATTGSNTIQANTITGVNNIEAKYNNIGVTTAASINKIGNTSVGTTVSSYGGTGYSVLNNSSATFGTNAALNGTTGGMVQTDATTASIRASNSGTLATNGSNGSMVVGAGGGYTAYATAQSTGTGSIGGVVDNKSYTNKISGNTYIDGNVYINGTLDYVSSNSANTSVIGATSATSVLAGATQATTAGTAIVLKGSTGTQTVVDANGKLTNVTGLATESTASLTLTNGVGNTHGLVVTETQSTLSGGVNSSSLTLSDNGATFSDSATGSPVQVHGVNDGTSDFDAVNIRQFAGAIASVTAMANIPQVDQDKTYAVGVGLGSFMGKTALAAGVTYRFTRNGVLKGSISSAMSSSNTTTVGLGAAWSY